MLAQGNSVACLGERASLAAGSNRWLFVVSILLLTGCVDGDKTPTSVESTAVETSDARPTPRSHELTHHEEVLASIGEIVPGAWHHSTKSSSIVGDHKAGGSSDGRDSSAIIHSNDRSQGKRDNASSIDGGAPVAAAHGSHERHLEDAALPMGVFTSGIGQQRRPARTWQIAPAGVANAVSLVEVTGTLQNNESRMSPHHGTLTDDGPKASTPFLRRESFPAEAEAKHAAAGFHAVDDHDNEQSHSRHRYHRQSGIFAASLAPRENSVPRQRIDAGGARVNTNSTLLQVDSHWFQNVGDSSKISWDGKVKTARDVKSMSELIRLEGTVEECMLDQSLPSCWEKYGSYSIRRLAAESYQDMENDDLLRPEWMNLAVVQAKKLFQVTFPGTHHSAAYMLQGEHEDKGKDLYGVVTQNLNIDQQLHLGIRSFHFNVAWAARGNRLYASHRYLVMPLRTALVAIEKYLAEHTSEIVLIHAGKDMEVLEYNDDPRYMKMITDEETDPLRIPGQLIHMEFVSVFGDMLATYSRLATLPADEILENPTIGTLQEKNIRVFYFWEGQQVLCTDLDACKQTPGWTPNPPGFTLPFGPPLRYGQRQQAQNSASSGSPVSRVVEPNCVFHFEDVSKQERPDRATRDAKLFAQKMSDFVKIKIPKCYPAGTPLPEKKEPTLLYSLEAVVAPGKAQIQAQSEILRRSLLVFSRGEGFSARSEAERMNFLLLVWLFKSGMQELYRTPNIIQMEFPAAILVNRIVDAMEGQKECGWAIYCKHTGSCWARSLLKYAADRKPSSDAVCEDEATMFTKIQTNSEEAFYENPALQAVLGMYFLGLLIYWQCFLFACGIGSRPRRSETDWLGLLFCNFATSDGDAEPEEEKTQGGPPETIYVIGTNEFDGTYEIVKDENPNEMPLWKWKDGDSWIFSGLDKKWYMGDEDEQQVNFNCSLGNFCSTEKHDGKLPHQIGATWMQFDSLKKDWTPYPDLKIGDDAALLSSTEDS